MADLQGLPNPDPILRAEGKSLSVYRRMVDGHLSAVIQKRVAAVRARPWTIERGAASARSTARLREVFDSLDVRTMTSHFLSALGMGYSVQEVVWEAQDWLVPVRVVDRPQEWFLFGLRGETRFIPDSGSSQIVEPRKLLVARHRPDYLNPYGRPILSECFWPLAFKRGGLKFWSLYCERFGIPKTIGKVPTSTTEDERTDLLRQLKSLVQDAVAVIPENDSVTLLETKVGGDIPFPALVKWADSEMSKAWLGETLSTEIQGQGSRAAAQAHNEVRADLALDDANLVESSMNELIRWIWEANSIAGPMPRFVIQMPEDLKAGRIERDKGLYGLGVRFSQGYFEDSYGISPEHILSVDGNARGATPTPGVAFAEAVVEEDHGETELAALLESMAPQELQGQMEEALKPLLTAIDQAASFGEIEDALDKLIPDLSLEQFQAAMTKCLLLSETRGRMDAHG